MSIFKLTSSMKPKGDQPQAIEKLAAGFESGKKQQVLLGVTGSGKTFTMAHVIAKLAKPTLVISHNKTLAAQLYSEFKEFFPENAVEYFVSYYDYYQPEAYIPQSDTYIEKDSSINDDLDRLRLAATSALLSRPDCIIVSSISCIYGLGSPEDWQNMMVQAAKGQTLDRDQFLSALVGIQYSRSETELERGTFRVRGSRVDLYPSYGENPLRIEFSAEGGSPPKADQPLAGAGTSGGGDDIVKSIYLLDRVQFQPIKELERLAVYPAKHFVTPSERLTQALEGIHQEMIGRVKELIRQGKDMEARRLESRTKYDLEMLREVGFCSGVENYSRHLSGREPGSAPYTLLDYFPKDFLIIVDECHQSIPQARGMYNGDIARKKILVEHGFRLPSALDNRPLRFSEFEIHLNKVLYVSATPGPYELAHTENIAEQIIRPTGLMDPEIEVRPTKNQIDDVIAEIKVRTPKKERTLITALTKKMAEDLSRYLQEVGIKVNYLHSELDAFERVQVLQDLRRQKYDCVVGVNLLREGLDLPEVSLVVVLDADKEGFLRSDTSLIQTAGRAARHIHGRVLMYADKMTDAIKKTIAETLRRRAIQAAYNKENGITPQSIQKEIKEGIEKWRTAETLVAEAVGESQKEYELKTYLAFLKSRMESAARALEFDKAARYRDEIRRLEEKEGIAESVLTKPAAKRSHSSS